MAAKTEAKGPPAALSTPGRVVVDRMDSARAKHKKEMPPRKTRFFARGSLLKGGPKGESLISLSSVLEGGIPVPDRGRPFRRMFEATVGLTGGNLDLRSVNMGIHGVGTSAAASRSKRDGTASYTHFVPPGSAHVVKGDSRVRPKAKRRS